MPDLFEATWTLVTGASSGLGDAFARQIAARGGNVIVTARSREKLEALAADVARTYGVAARAVAGDLAAPGGAAKLCAELDALGLPVDHVVNNAGFGAAGPFERTEAARLGDMIRLNCEALTVVSRHFIPGMLARGRGGFVHVASVAGLQPVPFMAVYAATKAFVVSLSAAMSEELRGTGVRSMALCPGPVPTGFQAAAGIKVFDAERAAVLSADETVRRGLAAYASGREVYVPGVVNSLTAIGSKVAPRAVLVRAAANMMRRGGRAR